MQVDTNTRGHQQWFYFRVKGGKPGAKYTFYINNFTKPGVTGGRGYKNSEHNIRILYRSKKQDPIGEWKNLTFENSQCEYTKTNIPRRKKDVIAAGADSDQEEWVEEAFNQNKEVNHIPAVPIDADAAKGVVIDAAKQAEKPKKRKVFYYYALRFQFEF
jgi:hypothetical protein